MKRKTFISFVIRANATLASFVVNRPLLLLLTKQTRIFGSTFLAPSAEFTIFFIPMKLLGWLDRVTLGALLMPIYFLFSVKWIAFQTAGASIKRLPVEITRELVPAFRTDFCFL